MQTACLLLGIFTQIITLREVKFSVTILTYNKGREREKEKKEKELETEVTSSGQQQQQHIFQSFESFEIPDRPLHARLLYTDPIAAVLCMNVSLHARPMKLGFYSSIIIAVILRA